MTKIIIITLPRGEQLLYTSIAAALADAANPVSISPRWWSTLAKGGYPFEVAGCICDLKYARTLSEVQNANT